MDYYRKLGMVHSIYRGVISRKCPYPPPPPHIFSSECHFVLANRVDHVCQSTHVGVTSIPPNPKTQSGLI